jgi:hypothetical protein
MAALPISAAVNGQKSVPWRQGQANNRVSMHEPGARVKCWKYGCVVTFKSWLLQNRTRVCVGHASTHLTSARCMHTASRAANAPSSQGTQAHDNKCQLYVGNHRTRGRRFAQHNCVAEIFGCHSHVHERAALQCACVPTSRTGQAQMSHCVRLRLEHDPTRVPLLPH